MEKSKEFIGGEEPFERLEMEIKALAEKAAEVEERARNARQVGQVEAAAKLNQEHDRLMAEQREKLKQVARLKEASLDED